jgi:hypothetical protein
MQLINLIYLFSFYSMACVVDVVASQWSFLDSWTDIVIGIVINSNSSLSTTHAQ